MAVETIENGHFDRRHERYHAAINNLLKDLGIDPNIVLVTPLPGVTITGREISTIALRIRLTPEQAAKIIMDIG